MMTNKKLLEEITVRSQNDNKALREQLQAQLTLFSESNTSIASDLSEQLGDIKARQEELSEQTERRIKELHQQLGMELCSRITESNKAEINRLSEEYAEKLEQTQKELEEKMDLLFKKCVNMSNVFFEKLTDIQKDNAIIMETLQVILANMLIDGVNRK